jgi:twitching motility protein PilJ
MNNSNLLWNLITRFFSFFAVLFLLLGGGLVVASHYGFTQNQIAGVFTTAFAVVMAVFALLALNYSNLKLNRQIREAAEIAHQISNGELFEELPENQTNLFDALKNISDYLNEKNQVTERIARGDLSGDITPRSDTDALGNSFRNMIEKLRASVQTQEERETLERSIRKLLDEVSDVADGDLTVQAEVSSEMTGAIAQAFNLMTKNLRSLIKQVKDVTYQISTSANAISDTTEQLARGSEAQASQISRTTSAISQMALRIQEVSENATLSAQVAADSLGNARYGTKAVQDNINAMNSIRKQVQETAKRIKKLGERSQEISQIVTLINDLSDRTSLLALNASLQAAAAGEAGQGFATVAEEVERLAERSNLLTHQISSLTQTIQTETKDVVASMEETIHEVVIGSTLADKAGRTLIEIEQVSDRLAELISSISESAKQQAESSDDITKAMANISKVTELVQLGSQRAADSVKLLVELSDELRVSIAPFKLPEDRRSAPVRTASGSSTFIN